jgi:hypothetical protein
MAQTIELETDRLCLRQWRKADFEWFAEMNADPKVMQYFPAVMSEGHTLRAHCLYRLSVEDYDAQPRVAADSHRRASPAGSCYGSR